MKLLCVLDSFISGGAQRQLTILAREFKKRGNHVEFYVYYPDSYFRDEVDEAEIPVHLMVKRTRFSIKPVFQLRRIIKTRGFTHVLAFLDTPAVYAELACIGLGGTFLAVSERNTVPSQKVTTERRFKSQLHRLANVVVTNSHAHREWLEPKFPYLRQKLCTIWNGVDVALFRPPHQRPAATAELKLLGAGRINEQKNVMRLVKALRTCRDQGMAVSLDWAGREDGLAYYRQVSAAIDENHLQGAWRWLGERKDMLEVMRRYDALILPSMWEGVPNVVCEALASGLPVLASHVSDIPLLIQDGVNGFLFAPEKVECIAEAIMRFGALSASARGTLATAGRAFAETRLSLRHCTDCYEQLLVGSQYRKSNLNPLAVAQLA